MFAWAVYDAWPSDEVAIGFNKSTDGGASYGTASRIINNIRGIRYSETSKGMRVNSFPSMAVDISGGTYNGYIYVVWANIGVPGVNTGSDIDVYMIRSTNNGDSWSSPIRVNQDPSGQGKEHFLAWITCDPTNGYLAVIYYDDRNVLPAECETYVSLSVDGGTTWEDIKVSDVAFSPARFRAWLVVIWAITSGYRPGEGKSILSGRITAQDQPWPILLLRNKPGPRGRLHG